MLFLGTTFFSGKNTLDPSPTLAKNIVQIEIKNGVFKQLFATKNPYTVVEEGYDDWDYDTILNADYSTGKLDAGNSGFSLSNTDYIAVKCRRIGDFDWITIYTKKINVIEDFDISLNDYYRSSNTDYEYMVVSVCNGIENNYVTESIHSEFNGMYICDKDNIYGTLFNLDYADTDTVSNESTLELSNNRYPSIVSNSVSNYETGNISGVFVKFNQDTDEIDINGSIQQRKIIRSWLNNKKPKILKFHDGRTWLISVSGNIHESGDNDNLLRRISFDWVEIGNSESMETLYNTGLSDIGKEWWY